MLPDLSQEKFSSHDGSPRILIIDDSKDFCDLLARYAKMLKCQPIIAHNMTEAIELLEKAQKNETPFTLATIDWRFQVGEGSESWHIYQGAEIVQYIKVEYPHVACLMISGETISPSDLLDIRDFYGVDYYLAKDRLEPHKVAKAFLTAVNRAKVVQNENKSFLSSSSPMSPRKLREIIDEYYNEEELKDLCFNLDIEYETLGGVGKSGKSRELITYAKRHGRYHELLSYCYDSRRHVFE